MSEAKYTTHQLETMLMRVIRVADILMRAKPGTTQTNSENQHLVGNHLSHKNTENNF